ncbi:MAG: F0F1 ATP synthase subunit A [Alphaproteobacteria bacterium]|nr:F0F1 ATP synthase subunit A [Alphaproteobacteria bacterium]
MASPMEQFNIKPLIPLEVNGYDISFTNSALFMTLAVVLSTLFLVLAMRRKSLIPGTMQSVVEVLYEFVAGIVKENIGPEGRKYFPFIFSIFIFVMFGNMLGLLPYSFTFTSHVSAVGTLALIAFLLNVVVGIRKKGWGWLHTFAPSGSPLIAIPVLVPIEIISFLAKPFSLTVRLAANMTVGHVMLKVIAGFVIMLGVGGILPLFFDCLIVLFEIGIGLLQAYIFTVLSCIYLGEALHEH